MSEEKDIKVNNWWNTIINFIEKSKFISALGIFIAIFAGVAEISGFSVKDLFFGNDEHVESKSLTVFVHGKKGRNQLILENNGNVEITYGTKKAKEMINEKGQAIFNEIPSIYFDASKPVLMDIRDTEGEPFSSTNPDSIYFLKSNKPVYLEVELKGLDRVFGTVTWNEKPLENVIVSVAKKRDTTDNLGFYEIYISEELQKKIQEIKFFKPEFKLVTKRAYPQTQVSLNVVMQKSEN